MLVHLYIILLTCRCRWHCYCVIATWFVKIAILCI